MSVFYFYTVLNQKCTVGRAYRIYSSTSTSLIDGDFMFYLAVMM